MYIPDSQTVILRKHLIDAGFFTDHCPVPSVAWKSYHSNMPDEVDHMVAVMRCKGRVFGSIARTNEVVEHFGVAIHVRSLAQDLGFAMASALDNKAGADRIQNVYVYVKSESINIVNKYKIENAYRMSDGVVEMGIEPGNRRRWCFVTEMNLVIRYLGYVSPLIYSGDEDYISFADGGGMEDAIQMIGEPTDSTPVPMGTANRVTSSGAIRVTSDGATRITSH